MNNDTKLKKLLKDFFENYTIKEIRDVRWIPIETKTIKSYSEYGDKEIAKELQDRNKSNTSTETDNQ